MSRALTTLLGKTHDKMFTIILDDLEKSTGDKTIDAKLIGDISYQAHRVIREIGLGSGFTAEELYYALRMHEDTLDASTNYAGIVVDGQVVSLNADDMMDDSAQSRKFSDRSVKNFRGCLAEEIEQRYAKATVRTELLKRFTQRITR